MPNGRQLGREALGHADERAFGGGVIAVAGFTALPGGGADEHDVPAATPGASSAPPQCFTRAKTLSRLTPTVVRHCSSDIWSTGTSSDGQMPWLATSTSSAPKRSTAARTSGSARRGAAEVGLHRVAEVGSQFSDQTIRLGLRAHVVEHDAGSGLDEQANRGRADAARASGDESDLAFQGKSDVGHGEDCSCLSLSS